MKKLIAFKVKTIFKLQEANFLSDNLENLTPDNSKSRILIE